MDSKAAKLKEIENQIQNCTKCGLCKTATNGVPGEGDPNSELMFIGEAPGFHEDQEGRPFIGRAGKLLEFLLKQIGYDRQSVWIGNIVKHRPPENRDPTPDEIRACKPYLTQQIEIINPKLIVTLGRFSMNYFLPTAKISEARGKTHDLRQSTLYPVYHPAAGLRNPTMKTALIADFMKIPDILNSLPKVSEIVKKTEPDLKLF